MLWVHQFRSTLELVHSPQQFRALYNRPWFIGRLGFQPPAQAPERLALEPAALLCRAYSLQEISGATRLLPVCSMCSPNYKCLAKEKEAGMKRFLILAGSTMGNPGWDYTAAESHSDPSAIVA